MDWGNQNKEEETTRRGWSTTIPPPQKKHGKEEPRPPALVPPCPACSGRPPPAPLPAPTLGARSPYAWSGGPWCSGRPQAHHRRVLAGYVVWRVPRIGTGVFRGVPGPLFTGGERVLVLGGGFAESRSHAPLNHSSDTWGGPDPPPQRHTHSPTGVLVVTRPGAAREREHRSTNDHAGGLRPSQEGRTRGQRGLWPTRQEGGTKGRRGRSWVNQGRKGQGDRAGGLGSPRESRTTARARRGWSSFFPGLGTGKARRWGRPSSQGE